MISVITPTYNRAHTLPALYNSLKTQTSNDFEWIIVDDGSSDNTEELVSSWKDNAFSLIYLKEENGGKHRALNKGIKRASGSLTLIVDSDDYLTSDAIDFLLSHEKEIEDKSFAGIAGLRGWMNKEGSIGGRADDYSYVDGTNLEREKLGLTEDKAEAYKTNLLKSHPFPEFQGEKFLWEGSVWDKLGIEGYKIRWYNHIIYKCEYLEDGLTNSTSDLLLAKNFQGYTYCMKQSASVSSLKNKILIIGDYKRVATIKGLSNREISKNLGVSKLLVLVSTFLFFLKSLVKREGENNE
ncbi:MAG: glycosyltransferase family 2 protein [Candidatus Ornithospirochaeta sp.]